MKWWLVTFRLWRCFYLKDSWYVIRQSFFMLNLATNFASWSVSVVREARTGWRRWWLSLWLEVTWSMTRWGKRRRGRSTRTKRRPGVITRRIQGDFYHLFFFLNLLQVPGGSLHLDIPGGFLGQGRRRGSGNPCLGSLQVFLLFWLLILGKITISSRAPLRSPQPLASLQVGRQLPRHGLVRYFAHFSRWTWLCIRKMVLPKELQNADTHLRSASSGPLSLGGAVGSKTGEGEARLNFTRCKLWIELIIFTSKLMLYTFGDFACLTD